MDLKRKINEPQMVHFSQTSNSLLTQYASHQVNGEEENISGTSRNRRALSPSGEEVSPDGEEFVLSREMNLLTGYVPSYRRKKSFYMPRHTSYYENEVHTRLRIRGTLDYREHITS